MADRPTRVVVDDLELNDESDPDLRWRFTKITGWHSGAGVDVDQTQRTGHGQFAQPGRRRGKVYTITGRLEATDRAFIAPAIDRLNALLADGGFGRLEFVDRTLGSRWTQVQLLNEPDVEWNGGPTARYQLGLLAPSPFKYGATSSGGTPFGTPPEDSGLVFPLATTLGGVLDFGDQGSTGVLQVANEGTAPSSIEFAILGPTPEEGFAITELDSDTRIEFRGQVPAGSVLHIDTATGRAVLDFTSDRTSDVVVTRWPVVPRGQSAEFLFASLGANTPAYLTATTTATYW